MTCHNPNLSSSGRAADPVLLANQAANVGSPSAEAHEAAINTIAKYGSDPLLYPEAPNNFKDMIHGIHAARVRSAPYEFVRDRGNSGIYAYDWSEVTYPNIDGNCLSCHVGATGSGANARPATYRVAVSANALPSTDRITTGVPAEIRSEISAVRATVPNVTDLVTSPQAASCTGCHDNPLAVAHMEQNGGAVTMPRAIYDASGSIETCDLCHGPGRVADVEVVHPILR